MEAKPVKCQSPCSVPVRIPCADESPAVYPAVPRKPKPDFHQAMGGDQAQQLYEAFIKKLAASDGPKAVATGVFGALMQARAQGPGGPRVGNFWTDSWSKLTIYCR